MEEYYNRNPISIVIGFRENSVDPHPSAIRESYTVPVGKKAILEYMYLIVKRETEAQIPGLVAGYLRFNDGGTHEQNILVAELFSVNIANAYDKQHDAPHKLLLPGQRVEIRSWDDSTGGKCTYNLITLLTEFDA